MKNAFQFWGINLVRVYKIKIWSVLLIDDVLNFKICLHFDLGLHVISGLKTRKYMHAETPRLADKTIACIFRT
jgi:hypothetical protein